MVSASVPATDGAASRPDGAEEYAAAVLALVRQIPPGRAMTYGLIAEIVGETLHRGGPRQVGQVMAGSGDRYAHLVPDGAAVVGPAQDNHDVPWWRVVNASGAPPARHVTAALDALRAEATPLTRDGRRVALARAIWFPRPGRRTTTPATPGAPRATDLARRRDVTA
ncbi:DNA-binding protein [Xylanimonas allomyrinae]|uniref:DNA-binding protein n=1 Tax=Xylanimonas allomyrinae TaxID=2509459 RepID=A0A4P6EI15_9MICO|nr:DNA-binding protein [Xylanimonas allomyrinae]